MAARKDGRLCVVLEKEDIMEQKQDVLLDDCACEFERRLITQCREDGMSDEEIAEWLKEI